MIVDSLLDQDTINARQLAIELSGVNGFLRLDIGNGDVLILFADGTAQVDVDEALAIAAAHTPGSLDVKLWRYIDHGGDRLSAPHDVDYITQITYRLHPTNSIIVDGEIRQVDYYHAATMDPTTGAVTYSDLIVRESFVYTRDAVGFARGRTQTITWYREDDTAHPATKTRVKLYEPDESLREGQRRRSNITDTLAMNMAGWLMVTQTQLPNPQDRLNLGRQFMRDHKLSFDMFIDTSSAAILTEVVADTTEWLDDELAPGVTIRATILDALNIWNLTL